MNHPPELQLRVSVRVLVDDDGLRALAEDWSRLHADARGASVFNSWLWQHQWWKTYGAPGALRLLAACEGEKTVGLLALYVHDASILGTHIRLLRPVGMGGDTHPDDLGPLLAPGYEESAATALAEAALQIPGTDVVAASDLHPVSGFDRALVEAGRRKALSSETGVSQRIAFLQLPSSWTALLTAMPASRRARLRSHRRKLERAHRVRFFVWDDAAAIDRAVDRLAHLHRARWRGASASFATTQYVEFHRAVIAACLPRGWLRLYCLEVEGSIAAMIYAYRFRGTVYFMQSGFDPAWARWHPGSVLLGHAIEHAIAEGNGLFDFLRGEHRYKSELASGMRETRFAVVYHDTLAARLYRLRSVRWPRWKRWLRELAAPTR